MTCRALILIKAAAPMLIAVGTYLPLETTFAIFVGGMILIRVPMGAARLASTSSD